MRRVWVDHWQMQCCGDAFATGREVEWTVLSADREWLASILDVEFAASVTDAEEHHASNDMTLTDLKGMVLNVTAVYCRYQPSSDERMMVPVPGSAVTVTCAAADGWETARDGMTFVGYVVDVDAPDYRDG